MKKHFVVISDRFDERGAPSNELAKFVSTFGPCKTIGVGKLASYRWQDVLATIVDGDLSDEDYVHALVGKLPFRSGLRSLFIVDRSYRSAAQAFSLGASEIFRFQADQDELGATLSKLNNQLVSPPHTSELASGILAARQVLGDLFEAGRRDAPIDMENLRDAGESIDLAISQSGIIEWISTVRRHHQGTYQHCLIVAGVAVAFGQALGFSRDDRYRIAKAALVHDIGKAYIATAVLDKPSRLSDQEMDTMRTHATLGANLLAKHHPDESELIDVTRHHHEMLDGSGYPDGIAGGKIADPVRLLTVCDIYSALIERRSYKPPFSREKAIAILIGMGEKLDRSLVMPFVAFVRSSQDRSQHC